MPAGGGVEAADTAVMNEAVDVKLGDGQRAVRKGLAFGEDLTALADEVMAAEDIIGGGLTLP